MRRCATKARVTSAIQQVNNLLELGDCEVGDFCAIKVIQIDSVMVIVVV